MTKPGIRNLVMIFTVLVCAAAQPAGSLASPQKPNDRKPSHQQPRQQPGGHEHEIHCPVKAIRAEITTPLPNPWWQTPQEGPLQSVGIQVIGGQKALVCRYSAYGTQVSVMRPFPEGVRDCRATGNHFVCW